MSDVRLIWHNSIEGSFADLALTDAGDLEGGQELATAVEISLFSDRLATASDRLAPGQDDRRGCWMDTDLQRLHPGDLIGSRIWLLARHTSDNRLPLTARGYILESLQWMIEDRVAAKVEATCFFLQGDQRKLGAIVTITRSDGSRPIDLQFDWAWQEIG